MRKPSAGIILYRTSAGAVEVLLVHPGGPFWAKKDAGAWSIPKGEADDGEEGDALLAVARREFEEEVGTTPPAGGYAYLGFAVRARDKKRVDAWMVAGEIDTAHVVSNTIELEWPPRSGKLIEIPEVDRAAFFALPEARVKLVPYLLPLLDAFEAALAAHAG